MALPSPGHRLVRGSILNIAERKRAEAALRESEARYRGLVDNATYGIYWVTLEGKLALRESRSGSRSWDTIPPQELLDVPEHEGYFMQIRPTATPFSPNI